MWSRARTLSAEPELVRRRLRQAEGESEISKGKPSLGFLRGRRYKVERLEPLERGKEFSSNRARSWPHQGRPHCR